MVGFYNYTVWLTYMSLISGTTGIALCFIKPDKPYLAIVCLLLSGFCDLFDGKVARTKKDRTEQEKSFGIQIDSLVDLVSFGVLPACILIAMALNVFEDKSQIVWLMPLAIMFVLFGMIRLAYYNTLEIERQRVEEALTNSFFYGLPITLSSLTLPLAYEIGNVLMEKGVVGNVGSLVIYASALFVVGVFFVIKIRIPKFQQKGSILLVCIGVLLAIGLVLAEIL